MRDVDKNAYPKPIWGLTKILPTGPERNSPAVVIRTLGLIAVLMVQTLVANAQEAAKPLRIASLGVCADQYILGMVEPKRIAALSPYATDPILSLYSDRAKGIPTTRGSAEELIALAPDLVVADRWGNSKTLSTLKRLGIPVLQLGLPVSFDEVMNETRRVAKAFGESKLGERLIADATERIKAVKTHVHGHRAEAVYIMPGGYTAGRGSFVDTVISTAGIDNLAAKLGKYGWTRLSMEYVINEDPDMLIFSFFRPGVHSLATRYRQHGPLARLAKKKTTIDMPERYWICGGWFLHKAVSYLAGVNR